ncbi:hypothetical protein Bca4012_050519 [Brassica carinata]|uniref:Uncharacterized protein n=1 Tax=Brassica carinata TaxID=52824 RepID=A0A8X7R8K0_BRACI|nr:hypothetical protein Bca52824_053223 [Brassica carinata]
MDTLQDDAQFASSGENKVIRQNPPTAEADDEESLTQSHLFNEPSRILGKRDRSEGKEERRLSDEAERSVDQRNRERLGEEPPSTPKKGDAETKVGRPSPEGKARTPEAKPADHQEKVRLRKQGPLGESETG